MKFSTLIVLLFVGIKCSAQMVVIMPAETKAQWNELSDLSKNFETLSPSDYQQFPIYKLKNGIFLSLMGKVKGNPNWYALTSLGVLRGSQIGNIATIKVPLQILNDVNFDSVFSYLEIPAKIAPDLNRVRVDVHADSVQNGWNLPEAYLGENVLIGVTDWGFDYTHPMFYDTLLQATRIVAAWDQYKQAGEQPINFAYGVEYNSIAELLLAGSDTANIYSYHTHGNHVAGIAGGSGAGTEFRGIAPKSGFLFTTFLVDAASVLDAFSWMKEKATQEDKRLVINMSWGLYWIGTLDGTSLLSQAIDALSNEGVVFVSSGGNNGDNNFHINKEFDNDVMTSRIVFDSYANPNLWGESITIWGEQGNQFDVKLQIYNSGNTLLSESPIYSTQFAPAYFDSILVINDDTIYFNLTTEAIHPLNARPHIRLRVKNTNTTYRVILYATAVTGTVHFWNLVELTNGVGNWGLDFISFGTTGAAGDANNSIGEPACTASVIAVAAYSAGYLSSGGNLLGGQLAEFSSIGPLITGAMKPDIAAPGVNVASSISSFTDASYTQFATINFNGVDYDFAKFSGTSMSSPCVAGIVALLLDANPNLTPAEIKTILQTTAREDNHTGDITPPGDVRWGYGKVNAYQAVLMALTMVEVREITALPEVLISPNPTNDFVNILMKDEHEVITVTAIGMDGKRTALQVEKQRVDCSKLASGVYVLEVSQKGLTHFTALIKL